MHFVSIEDKNVSEHYHFETVLYPEYLTGFQGILPHSMTYGAFSFRLRGINKFYSPFHSSELLGGSVLKDHLKLGRVALVEHGHY
jgi:hypothetical protein